MKQPTKKQVTTAINTVKQSRPEITKLINSVLRITGREYDQLTEISRHGCISGVVGGLIYYRDTVKFYRTHKREIMELLNETTYNLGETVIEIVKGFNCLNNNYSSDEIGNALYGRYNPEYTQIYNALAWFACEEIVYLIIWEIERG